ncbi:hypothetical protein MGYG_04193 [Nannizzia gypsea CBS 118893]|uniref:Uncharacterized protein n=1 Tax=Arthroderma gypseum (strain ATCC MYA-4604 / CBS 118893) TaxID=535722 RepID=E4URR9_ARTGP|nr:hypothetical protein MGYG_04193 [Nannizzia gypsea CBS 118893]EFR01191.1 hypothetical protein MGYG_04193 [Nannizzia gypsea CBS 118893]
MADKGTRKGSLGARRAQNKGKTRINKGKQRQEPPPIRPQEQSNQQQVGELPLGFVPGPAYLPQLSGPGHLPEYKPVPNASGRIRVVPEDPPMPKFELDANKPFTDKRRVSNPLHVRKSTGPEQIFPANIQGYQWAVAAGYDGCLLPNPPLTAILKDNHVSEDRGSQFSGREFEPNQHQCYINPTTAELIHLAQGHAYTKGLNPKSVAFPTVKLPALRGVVVKAPRDSKEESGPVVLPDIRKAVRLIVATLPHLSRGFLADHIISTWKNRDWHAIGVPRPEYTDWTSRTISRCRITNRGHSNGYQSFGDFAQLDFDSPSLGNFSIMKSKYFPDFRNMSVVPRESSKPEFNIFQHLVKHPELVIIMAKYLRVQELLILYSMSRPFHHIVRNRITGIIISQAQRRAMESSQIFPFRCFNKLCFTDPARQPHPVRERAMAGEVRQVPSFKWLLMVCYREMVCHEIVTIMAEDGVPVPGVCSSVLKKIWLLMDIPDNHRRLALVRKGSIFSDVDLFFAMLLFVKFDMRFTDPITGNGKDGMRRLLLAQPSLTVLWRALRRTALVSKLDVMKLYVRWRYHPPHPELGQTIFGIPPNEIGMTQYEGWGKTRSRYVLLRPDELIIRESVRRGLNLQFHYTDMFLWGYVNPRTRGNTEIETFSRTLDRLEGMEEILVPKEERMRAKLAMSAVHRRT